MHIFVTFIDANSISVKNSADAEAAKYSDVRRWYAISSNTHYTLLMSGTNSHAYI